MVSAHSLFKRENPKVKLMCDLNKIVVGHREFSFEEIRRQCLEKAGRYMRHPQVQRTVSDAPQ